MRTLKESILASSIAESILDPDLDVVGPPNINFAGSDKLVDIMHDFLDKGAEDAGRWKLKKYVLRTMKNIFDENSKFTSKRKPTKKWALVFYTDNAGEPRNPGRGGSLATEEIYVFKLNQDGSFRRYVIAAHGDLVDETELRVMDINFIPNYVLRWHSIRSYQIPNDICELMDWCLGNRGMKI